MRLLTAGEQRELDRLANEEAGLPTRVLMESAGAAVARAVLALHPRRVLVYCGPGNNGGDGSVAARLLSDTCEVYTKYTRAPEHVKGDAASAMQAWRDSAGIDADDGVEMGQGTVVVDAVFGSGLSRAPDGAEAEAIRAMNAAREKGVGQPLVLARRVGLEALFVGSVEPGNHVAGDRDLLHLTGVDVRHEIAESHRPLVRRERGGGVPHQHPDHDEQHPEQHTLQRRVHPRPPASISFKITIASVRSVLLVAYGWAGAPPPAGGGSR